MTVIGTRSEHVRGVLRACPQLQGLDAAATEALAEASTVRSYAAGEPVFLEGAPGDAMYVVQRGAVVTRISTAAGNVLDLGDAVEGQAFGYFEVLRPGRRTEDAVAVRDSTVVVLPAVAALRALRSSPDTLLALARDLVRIVGLQTRVRSCLRRPVDRRLAALLLDLPAGGDVVDFGGSQTLLAQRLGIARQTVNSALRTLADRGLLVLHPGGRAATLDRAGLAAHAAS